MHVAQEGEGELVPLVEFRVREGRVAADSEQDGTRGLKLGRDIDEAAELGASDTSPVVAVEEEYHVGDAFELGQRDVAAARRGQGECRSVLAVAQHGQRYSSMSSWRATIWPKAGTSSRLSMFSTAASTSSS